MKSLPLTLLSVCLLPVVGLAQDKAEDGFRSMLNKNLDGWVRTNTPESTWQMKGDMLICSGKPIGEIRTTKMYQNFIMEVEWRHMVPRGNAGIFIWADDITAKGVPFHRGIEVQVLENAYGNTRGYTTHGDIFPIHGAKMTPINGRGGSRAFPTENRSKPSPGWNHYRIECRDGNISLAVNGKVVTKGTKCNPRKGYICLESEGGVVHYRNMKIKELPGDDVSADKTAIANRGYRSIYNGLDVTEWTGSKGWASKDWILACQSTEGGSLTSKETFGDVGFVFDLKHKHAQQKTVVKIRGAEFQIDQNSEADTKLLGKPGRWNRFEGEVVGGKLVVKINGQPFRSTSIKANKSGPIAFATTANTDFANLYVRPIGKLTN